MTLHIDYKLPLFVSVYIKHFHTHKNIYLRYMYADGKTRLQMLEYIYGRMKKHSIYLAQVNILFMYFCDEFVRVLQNLYSTSVILLIISKRRCSTHLLPRH